MSKLEEFREFAKSLPHLKEMVRQNKATWQELFERYDIYGSEDEIFLKKKEEKPSPKTAIYEDESEPQESKKEGLGGIFDALSGFDADKITDGLNGMKRILSIIGEVSKVDEPQTLSKRKMSRPYQRNDD